MIKKLELSRVNVGGLVSPAAAHFVMDLNECNNLVNVELVLLFVIRGYTVPMAGVMVFLLIGAGLGDKPFYAWPGQSSVWTQHEVMAPPREAHWALKANREALNEPSRTLM